MLRDPEEVAAEIANAVQEGAYATAATWLMRITDNGRRTLIRIRTERLLSVQQIAEFNRYVRRLEPEEL